MQWLARFSINMWLMQRNPQVLPAMIMQTKSSQSFWIPCSRGRFFVSSCSFWIFWRVFKRPPRFLFKTYKKHKHALWWASIHHVQVFVWKAFLCFDEIYCKFNFVKVPRFFYFLVLFLIQQIYACNNNNNKNKKKWKNAISSPADNSNSNDRFFNKYAFQKGKG